VSERILPGFAFPNFAQEFDASASGGVFIVFPADSAMANALSSEFRGIDGVVEVIEVPSRAYN